MTDFTNWLVQTWKRSRSSTAPARFQPRLECLEDRTVPANAVTTSIVGSTLFINAVNNLGAAEVLNGDHHQDLVITRDAVSGAFIITSNEDRTTIDGQASRTISGPGIKNIKLNLGAGDDSVEFRAVQLDGTLTFLGGDGDNRLTIDSAGGVSRFGAIAATNGDGFDRFEVGNGKTTVERGVTVKNGHGGSDTRFGSTGEDRTAIGGALTVTNGSGNDAVVADGARFSVGGAVTIALGAGEGRAGGLEGSRSLDGARAKVGPGRSDNRVEFTALETILNAQSGKTAISTGSGGSRVALGRFDDLDSIFASRSVSIRNGDATAANHAALYNAAIHGSLSIRNGTASSNTVDVAGAHFTVAGATSVVNGAAFDRNAVDFSATQMALGAVNITNGTAGSNAVHLGYTDFATTLTAGKVSIRNGSATGNGGPLPKEAEVLFFESFAGGGNRVQFGGDVRIAGRLAVANGTSPDTFVGADGTRFIVTHGVSVVNAVASVVGVQWAATATQFNTLAGATVITNRGGNAVIDLGGVHLNEPVLEHPGHPKKKADKKADFASIESPAEPTFASRSLTITNGNGTTATTFWANTAIAGNLRVTNAAGYDEFRAERDFLVTGAAAINHGNGGSLTAFVGLQTTLNQNSGATRITNRSGPADLLLGSDRRELPSEKRPDAVTLVEAPDEPARTFQSRSLTVRNGVGQHRVLFGVDAVTVAGNLTITNGEGFDEFTVTGNTELEVTGHLTINNRGGGSRVLLDGPSTEIGGRLTIRGADGSDAIVLTRVQAALRTLIETGNDRDGVGIESSTLNGLTIRTGTGSDLVAIERHDVVGRGEADGLPTELLGNVFVDLGAGDDQLLIGLDESDFADFARRAVFNGGGGLDTMTFGAGNVFRQLGQPAFTGIEAVGEFDPEQDDDQFLPGQK